LRRQLWYMKNCVHS